MPQPQPPHADPKSIADYVDGQVGGYALVVGTVSTNKTLDLGQGATQKLVLGASGLTITLGNFKPTGLAQRIRLLLTQDGTGTRLLPTFVPALNYGTPGAPTLTTTAGKTDVLELLTIDGGTTVLCTGVVKGF